jgi:hypothetical protein
MGTEIEIGSVADWLAALGTIAACVIALSLARKQGKPQCSLHSSLWGYSEAESSPTKMRAIDITARNVGYQPFAVGLCMLWIGAFRPSAFEIRGDTPGGPRLLEHAESVKYTYALTEIHGPVQGILRARRFGWIERYLARTFRAAVYLSSGQIISCRLDRASRRYLMSESLLPDVAELSRNRRLPDYLKARNADDAP